MRSKFSEAAIPIVFGVAACAIFFWLSRILMLDYPSKSAIKVLMFIGLPFFSWLVLQRMPLRDAIRRLLAEHMASPVDHGCVPTQLGSGTVGDETSSRACANDQKIKNILHLS